MFALLYHKEPDPDEYRQGFRPLPKKNPYKSSLCLKYEEESELQIVNAPKSVDIYV
jgi:hypothetical protein